MWLLAAWAMLNISQALAACCVSSGDPLHAPAAATSPQHHAAASSQHHAAASPQHHAVAQDDCCDTETLEQPCPMVLGPAPSLAAPTTDYAVRGQNPQPIALPVQLSPLVPAVAVVLGPARIPISPVPADSILLRLQRFLI